MDDLIVVDAPVSQIVVTATSPDQVVVVGANADIVTINDVSIPGPIGPQGVSPDVSVYKKANLSASGGVLSINASSATTFYVVLDQNISSIVVTHWPTSGMTQRLAIYVEQDSVGNRAILSGAWPSGTRSSQGERPNLSTHPGAIDCFILDTFDNGQTIFATMVGFDYS